MLLFMGFFAAGGVAVGFIEGRPLTGAFYGIVLGLVIGIPMGVIIPAVNSARE